jgi:enoyl-CoA hydratase
VTAVTWEQVRYEQPATQIARIVMARPEARNAQALQMTYELAAAFDRAAHDDAVKVIILAGDGPHFSAGHDMGGDAGKTWRDFPTIGVWAGFDAPGMEGRFGREKEIYLELCERWRNLPKPTIAAVQGVCVAGGLMLAWACDLIVAAEDARFKDPTLEFGVCGAEFFMHPWELGVRKAKEWLFTADWLSAEEARERGMVNRVVPGERLSAEVMDLAERVARKPSFALKTTKEVLNQVQDGMGRRNSMLHSFALHHLCHAHNELVHGALVDPNGVPEATREKFMERIARAKAAAQAGSDGR